MLERGLGFTKAGAVARPGFGKWGVWTEKPDTGSGVRGEFQRKTPGQTKHYGRLTGRRVGDILAAGKKGGLKFLSAMMTENKKPSSKLIEMPPGLNMKDFARKMPQQSNA